MSIFPRKYHDSRVKCAGPQYCSDCRERTKLRIPIDLGIQDRKNKEQLNKDSKTLIQKNDKNKK